MAPNKRGRPLDNTDVKMVQVETNGAEECARTNVTQPVAENEAITADRNPSSAFFKPYSTIFVITLLALVIWVAHFWYSRQFGLYEDDWHRIPKVIGTSWHDLWTLIRLHSRFRPSEGRPFHPALIMLFSFLGFKAGGLHAVYTIAFAIALTNAILFYWFLKRVVGDGVFALLGALAFSLFPADTTQSFLTHALGVQPSITLVLLAFHCYLSDWKKCSYVFILLTLFTYETPFPVFFVAPLLQRRPKSQIVRHCVVLMAILTSVIVLRALAAESRVSHLGLQELLLFLTNPITGPLVTLLQYVYRPLQALFLLSGYEPLALLACCIGLAAILSRGLWSETRSTRQPVWSSLSCSQPALIGLIMLIAAYPLTLTTLGFAVAGRGTRAHTAAIFGGSILCACACSVIFSRSTSTLRKCFATVGVASFFTLLLAFGLSVQRDYLLSWQEQRGFWTDFVRLCPDLSDGDVIFVEPTGLRDTRQLLFLRKEIYGVPDTRQIKSLDTVFDVLPEVYRFPAVWMRPPRVYRLPLDWEKKIFVGENELRTISIETDRGYAFLPVLTVPGSKVIFLETKNGRLTRRTDLPTIDGERLKLKKDVVVSSPLEESSIYPYLILPPEQMPAKYLVR
jgi:hypothetical protein